MNRIYRAYRFRLYPGRRQAEQMARTFGCCRFLYNCMLADKIRAYETDGKMLRNTPAQYKREFPWLKEVDSLALANVQLHLEAAYRNFFRNPKTGYPKFRSKHHSRDSYTTNVVNGNIRLEDGRLKLPKTDPVKIIVHRQVPADGHLKSVTVVREPSGKYYASLLYEQAASENQTAVPVRPEKVLGIDFAMAGLAVFSDGTRAEYPMYYRKAEKKLAREQRKLSLCRKGSRNYAKQKRRVARCHERVRNQRTDYQNKLSLQEVSEELHVNSSYFSALFRQEISMTFTDYLNQLRIGQACHLLSDTEMSIMEIAAAVGFDDQSYFTRVFRKYKGITPHAYRKSAP